MLTANGRRVKDYVCLSTDTKPVGVSNGSMLLEMDTGKIYVFDEQNNNWIEIA